MVGLLIFLGIALIAAAIVLAVYKIRSIMNDNAREKERFRDNYAKWVRLGRDEEKKIAEPEIKSLKWVWVLPTVLLVVGLITITISSAVLETRDGFAYRVITPNGTKTAIMVPGYHLIHPFARVQEWNKYIDIRTIPLNAEGNLSQSPEGVEGIIRGGIPIRFTDQVVGETFLSVRAQLPEDDASFLKIAEVFRHPANLTNNTLVPTIREQIINTTYMFNAEGYVNGEAGEYRQTIDDALKNGGFKMIKTEFHDTIYADDFSVDAIDRVRTIKEIKKVFSTEKVLDANGVPVRYTHDIGKNHITIASVIVEQVELEEKFQIKLEQQRDIAANKSIETDKIAQARISQQRIVAEGERDKARERVEKEKEQVGVLIAIETEVKKEENKRQLAEIAVETSKLNAAKIKIDANAKAYEIAQADGLSAEMAYKIDAEVETRIGVAKAIAGPTGLTLPTTTISGGGKGEGGDITTLLLLQLLEQGKK